MKFFRTLKEVLYPLLAIVYYALGLLLLYILCYVINIIGILLAP